MTEENTGSAGFEDCAAGTECTASADCATSADCTTGAGEPSGAKTPVSGADSPGQLSGADAPDGRRESREGTSDAGAGPERPIPEGFRKVLDSLPALQKAEERVRDMEIRGRIDGQLREIAALDPEVSTLRDLRGRPEYRRLCAMVERGYELSDAYKVLNFEEFTRRSGEAARQAALNELAAKSHLRRTSVRGEGAAPVPPEMAEEYRMLNPGASDAEIQAHYNRYTRGG